MKADDQGSFYVLLVENDPVTSELFKRSFETSNRIPYHVDQAYSVDEALIKLRSNPYHILLAEYEIEDNQGLQLIEQVKNLNSQVLCVLLATSEEECLKKQALNAGAEDLVLKNKNNIHELMEKLNQTYKLSEREIKVDPQDRRRSSEHIPFPVEPEDELQSASIQDELTGLYSHSYLHDRIVHEFARVNRYHYPIACIVLDIDHFKTINEEYGYRGGDALLQQCSQLLFENCRLSDVIARYSGEEFAILLPHTDYTGAGVLGERLKRAFADHVFEVEGEKIRLTISIGASAFPVDQIDQYSEIIDYATQALFRSKAMGRNCITRYQDIIPSFGEQLPEIKISEGKILEFQRKMTEVSNVARKAYLDASRTLITLLESKDSHTAGHSGSVAKNSMQIAQMMGMSVEESETVHYGALLHDLGKICIPDHILLKPAKLTFQEYETMKQHAFFGYKIIKPIQFLQQEALVVLHHHEWYNGEGYPCKLKGKEIPLGARIVSVADTYDTMRLAGGRYKKTTSVVGAVNELIAYSGTQFDPTVVAAFIEVLKMRKELSEGEFDRSKLDQALAILKKAA